MSGLSALGGTAMIALRPGPGSLAVAAALRALGAAGAIALAGAIAGDLPAVSVAYLGAACSVAFITGGVYKNRFLALVTQAVGASVGIVVGSEVGVGPVLAVAAAVGAGLVSGLIGGIGPNAPGFGMMLSIGVTFGQFGGSDLSAGRQTAWYLTGTAVVAIATLSPWLFRRGALERDAIAEVFFAAADTCAAASTPERLAARSGLATATSAARAAAWHPVAQQVAYAVAVIHAEKAGVPQAAVDALRLAGRQVRAGTPIVVRTMWPPTSPGLGMLIDALATPPAMAAAPPSRRVSGAIRSIATWQAWANGCRIALCMGIATVVTVTMHEPAHAFWLPLTVAVIVRPEYASVFVRTVNRVCGTVVGALLAAGVLAVLPPGIPIAVAAATALSFAVLTAPKLYGLNVIGVTASALLSSSIAHADPVVPGLRVLDTLIGAAIAMVFGYLLWPGARRLPQSARLNAAVDAANVYLVEAAKSPEQRTLWQIRRDDAYRSAHQARAACLAALAEPPPVHALAERTLPYALELEQVVDMITAAASVVDTGADASERIEHLRQRLIGVAAGIHLSDR